MYTSTEIYYSNEKLNTFLPLQLKLYSHFKAFFFIFLESTVFYDFAFVIVMILYDFTLP